MYTPSQITSQNMQGAITQLYGTRVFNKREIENGVSFIEHAILYSSRVLLG